MDLMAQGRELSQQGVQVDGRTFFPVLRKSGLPLHNRLLQPGAKILQDGIDGRSGQGLRVTFKSAFRDILWRDFRHVISSMMA